MKSHKVTHPVIMILVSFFALGTISSSIAAVQHERLQFRNSFQTPEEVVKYYCARDASGFVWSGLLEVERRAFTLWQELPAQDSFYIAKAYEIAPAKTRANEALVEVRYDILGIGDAHGTIMPAPSAERRVTFRLVKNEGVWKISQPEAAAISPVILASKFGHPGTP
ncbi:MAG: hypothetical protein A2X94_16095 [Bdellovibrionales bacterium GWB1_55_8]|nr:MAG: hypothetical protein A2X94_16095 [Bdellovibrionales bacterium GWB1_55_8]